MTGGTHITGVEHDVLSPIEGVSTGTTTQLITITPVVTTTTAATSGGPTAPTGLY